MQVVTGAAALLTAYMDPTPALADTVEAALVRAYQNNPQLNAQRASLRSTETYRSFGAAEITQLSVLIYQGEVEYSLIRQSKESLAQQRLNLDQTRDQVRANTIAAWGQLIASKAQVASAQAQSTCCTRSRRW